VSDWLFGNSGMAFGYDARAMSEEELRLRDAQMAWAYANAKPSLAQCAGMANYRPPEPALPALPDGWAEWFKFGDLLQ
jgi:hypothetical protein